VGQTHAVTRARCQRFPFCAAEAGHPGDCEIRPQAGYQEEIAACGADGALGGGAVGAGKSLSLLLEPLRWIHLPGFTAAILRKEKVDLLKAGGLWHKAKQLYPAFGGDPHETDLSVTFDSGAMIHFDYVDPRKFERQHQGPEFGFLGLDELTHFTRAEWMHLLTRIRCPALTGIGVRPYWRATCNPDPDSWVRELVDWWIGPDGWPLADRAGVVRYYLRPGGKEIWADTAEELLRRFPRKQRRHVKSFAFVPGRLEENQYVGDEYDGNIEEQDEEVALRWRGNWNARSVKGKIFRPEWFLDHVGRIKPQLLVDRIPEGATLIRPWDLAATAEAECSSETSHSWTAGPLLGLHEGLVYFGPAMLGRWDGGAVEQVVTETAKIDGPDVRIWFCRERAGAGKSQLQHYVRLLQGHQVDGEPETGAKDVRLQPLATQAKFGHFRFVRDEAAPAREDGREWAGVATLIRHLLRLPDKPNDVGDAAAAGYAQLCGDGDTDREVADLAIAAAEDSPLAHSLSEALDTSGSRGITGW